MASLTPREHIDDRSRLTAYDHGATLATWELDGRPVVWLSPDAVLDGTAALRGGVPICFPWFGAGPSGDLSPSHGVARTATWSPVAPVDDEVWAWELTDVDVAQAPGAAHLPGPFRARYAVSLPGAGSSPQAGSSTQAGSSWQSGSFPQAVGSARSLALRLDVANTGDEDYVVEAALHTYLAVGDVRQVRVTGLDAVPYLDKVTGERKVQEGDVTLGGETDAVFDSPGSPEVVVHDGDRTVRVASSGATQTVVWNPWAEKAAAISDLPDDAWPGFLCVEAAATGALALPVAAHASTTLMCTLTVGYDAAS